MAWNNYCVNGMNACALMNHGAIVLILPHSIYSISSKITQKKHLLISFSYNILDIVITNNLLL
jgi:hypothetical protein